MTKPSKVHKHRSVCEQLTKIYEKKNADYGDSFSESFKEYGLTMSCIRLGDKLNRIKSLRNNVDIQVKDETLEDTLLDLANYCILTLIELDTNNK